MQWFRFYHDALDDPKVQLLPPELFRTWVNLLCVASRETPRGTLPVTLQVAFLLRMTVTDAQAALDALVERGLLDVDDDGTLRPHNWAQRQRKSDDVAARVAAHRDTKRDSNVTRNVPAPRARERATETETETEENPRARARARARSTTVSPTPAREPDPWFEALALGIYGKPHTELLDTERAQLQKPAADLKRQRVDPAEIGATCAYWRESDRWGALTLKASGLVGNWTLLRNEMAQKGGTHATARRAPDEVAARKAALLAERRHERDAARGAD